MAKRTYALNTKAQRERMCRDVMRAPPGWVGVLSEGTRTLDQNAKLHAMLSDIQRQVPDMRAYCIEDMKLRFMDALGTELRMLPKLDGQGFFPVGPRTSTLTVEQFSMLIELLFQYGAEHGVEWSEPQDKGD